MRIDIDVAMQYQLSESPMVMLNIEAAMIAGQGIVSQELRVQNATLNWIEGEGGLGQRIWARVSGDQLQLTHKATVDVTRPPVVLEDLMATPAHELPGAVLSYLRPSRFCQSDLFTFFVGQQFSGIEGGAKVLAIRDWVLAELWYVPGSSNPETTATDTFASRQGVCRDYAHMVCALARAAGIPARYASVYGAEVSPPDFHAVAEVWLEGQWHLVDATGMCAPEGLVIIAAGRDAGDVPFMETYTPAQVISQTISVVQRDSHLR